MQLTSDGHKMYLEAVEDSFGAEIDYAMVQKIYADDPQPQICDARAQSRR